MKLHFSSQLFRHIIFVFLPIIMMSQSLFLEIFLYCRYRDPNSVATIKAFEGAARWAADGGITEEDVEEAKLGLFQGLDSPVR